LLSQEASAALGRRAVELKTRRTGNMFPRISRNASLAASIALGVALGALPAAAQTPKTPADSPAAVPAPGNPTEMTDRAGKVDVIEGSVRKVDAGAGTLQLSAGPLGIMNRTLEVGEDTQISVDGRQGKLTDLQEGTKVKAAYESREGKNVATRIEVLPAQ